MATSPYKKLIQSNIDSMSEEEKRRVVEIELKTLERSKRFKKKSGSVVSDSVSESKGEELEYTYYGDVEGGLGGAIDRASRLTGDVPPISEDKTPPKNGAKSGVIFDVDDELITDVEDDNSKSYSHEVPKGTEERQSRKRELLEAGVDESKMGEFADKVDLTRPAKTHGEIEVEEKFLDLMEGYELWTDETINEAVIDRLKSNDISKPPLVSHNRWVQPKGLSERHKAFIHLLAVGMTLEKAGRQLGYSMVSASRLSKMPIIQNEVQKLRDEYFGQSRDAIKSLVQKAYAVVNDILEDKGEKSSVRLDAAKYVIDQTVGKAQQTVTVGGSLLSDLISKLDQASRVVRDVANSDSSLLTATNDKVIDVNDVNINNNVDELSKYGLGDIVDDGFVIGKREG